MPERAREKRFKFIAFSSLVFFYPSRHESAIVEYWDPIILQLLIIKSFAKLATEKTELLEHHNKPFCLLTRDINCTLISLKRKTKHDDLLKTQLFLSQRHKTHSFLIATANDETHKKDDVKRRDGKIVLHEIWNLYIEIIVASITLR